MLDIWKPTVDAEMSRLMTAGMFLCSVVEEMRATV
jgi:hypothetical protein